MATRRKFNVTVNGQTQQTIAWNSAIRKGEEMIRVIARSEGVYYHGGASLVTGGKPAADGAVYTRVWTGDNGNRHMVHVTAA